MSDLMALKSIKTSHSVITDLRKYRIVFIDKALATTGGINLFSLNKKKKYTFFIKTFPV